MKERTTQVLIAVVALLLAANLISSAVVADAPPSDSANVASVLRAQLIELVDANGVTRAQFKVEEGGEAVFRMRDQKGNIRVKLGAAENGSGFALMDDHTEPGVHILAKNTGTSLTLAEKEKEKRVIAP
jgi:hypothetical protein